MRCDFSLVITAWRERSVLFPKFNSRNAAKARRENGWWNHLGVAVSSGMAWAVGEVARPHPGPLPPRRGRNGCRLGVVRSRRSKVRPNTTNQLDAAWLISLSLGGEGWGEGGLSFYEKQRVTLLASTDPLVRRLGSMTSALRLGGLARNAVSLFGFNLDATGFWSCPCSPN